MEAIREGFKKLADGGLRKWLLLAAVLGVALFWLSGVFGNGQKEPAAGFSISDYRAATQKDLERLLAQIEGAGKTRVLLTMENSAEYVYLENGTTKTKEIQPRIRGVLVLCEGGNDPVTIGRVTEAVTKALDISTAKVCIEKLTE